MCAEEEGEEASSSSSEEASEEAVVRPRAHPYLGPSAGCTAVVALVRGSQLLVANAGDSRCVACQEGTAVAMTEDHKPTDAPEHGRITKVSDSRHGWMMTGQGAVVSDGTSE